MRSLIALLMLLSISFQAKAYDEDTHFYATYAMARYAGIKHDVAVRIALTTQWMDESFLSDPMSLIVVPLSGVKKRRLLHFPSDRKEGKLSAEVQRQAMGVIYQDIPEPVMKIGEELMKLVKFNPDDLERMVVLTETQEDHHLATQLLRMGLENGDLMQASASLHVLEDSFAHAGTPAGEGHRGFWHWPDRPFDDVPKYFRMTESVFNALVAIRLMLPTSALDCTLKTTESGSPNCSTNAATLQAAYEATPIVKETVSFNTLKNKEYILRSTHALIKGMVHPKYGYMTITPRVKALLETTEVDGKKDVYQILVGAIVELADAYIKNDDPSLNMKKIMSEYYSLNLGDPKTKCDETCKEKIVRYIKGFGRQDYNAPMTEKAFNAFAENLSGQVLRVFVPRELSKNHRMELELDGDLQLSPGKFLTTPRTIEMEIRVRNMQKLVNTLYPEVNLQFVANNSKDEKGFAAEVRMLESAQPRLPKKQIPGVQYVTFNLAEKHRFNFMIFHYLYPYLKDQNLTTIVDLMARAKDLVDYGTNVLKNLDKKTDTVVKDTVKVAGVALSTPVLGEIRGIAEGAGPFALSWLQGLAYEEVTTNNHDYHHENNILRLKDGGVIKPFLTEDDTWNEQMTVNNYKTRTAKIAPATVAQ